MGTILIIIIYKILVTLNLGEKDIVQNASIYILIFLFVLLQFILYISFKIGKFNKKQQEYEHIANFLCKFTPSSSKYSPSFTYTPENLEGIKTAVSKLSKDNIILLIIDQGEKLNQKKFEPEHILWSKEHKYFYVKFKKEEIIISEYKN